MDKLGIDKEIFEAEKYLNKVNDSFLDKNINKSQTQNNFTPPKNKNNIPDILGDYQKKLKLFGFPEFGEISLSQNPAEQEKTLKFFDYIIRKKANESQDFKKYQLQSDTLTKKCEALENQVAKYEKEIKSLNEELKKTSLNKKDYELKLSKQKDSYEKQIISLKNSSTFLSNKLNKLTIDKRAIEEKYTKVAEAYSKLTNNKNKIINSIELIEYAKQNDICKMLSKVKGAEKLVEMLKNGYNESFRELLFEISCLKNFILDIHTDIKQLIEYPTEINEELLNMPFLDTANQIKLTFTKNIMLLRAKLGIDEDDKIELPKMNHKNNLINYNQKINDEDDKILFNTSKKEVSISSIPDNKNDLKIGSNTYSNSSIKEKLEYFEKKFLSGDNLENDNTNETHLKNDTNNILDDLGFDKNETEMLKNKWTKLILSDNFKSD